MFYVLYLHFNFTTVIIFTEAGHKYTHFESGNNLKGWTSLISKFTKPFNREAQLTCSAYKLLLGDIIYNNAVQSEFRRLYDLDVEKVKDFLEYNFGEKDAIETIRQDIAYEWDYVAINGTKCHRELEKASFERGWEINPFTGEKYDTVHMEKQYDNQSLADNLFDIKDGYYPELLVWDNTMDQSQTVVTQIDKCFIQTIKKKRYVDIGDYKFNRKRPDTGKKYFMKAPLDMYNDNKAEKYKMQARFGAFLLSTFGFIPRNCSFTHYLHSDLNKGKDYIADYDHEIMLEFQKEWIKITADNQEVTS